MQTMPSGGPRRGHDPRPTTARAWARKAQAWCLRVAFAAGLVAGAAAPAVATPAAAAPAAAGRVHALLVGVSGYPGLERSRRLQGPPNDVRRFQRLLLARGVQAGQIEVLADGLPGAGLPTRARILESLASLATRATHGDTVVLMFAGHGSRQPAAQVGAAPEPLFLPLDVARWDPASGRVVNAIAAHELRAAVDRIAARGALVWGVFDTCHAARLVRGTEQDGRIEAEPDPDAAESTPLRWRQVPPQQLGIPASAQASGAAGLPTAAARAVPAAEPGRTALFYATQTHEATPELPLPAGVPGARVHGVFSHVLLSALERAGAVSYRQLAQQVLAGYAALDAAQANPLFSGNALDAPVLGGAGDGAGPRQWPLERDGAEGQPGHPPGWAVSAGALAGLAPGAVLAVLPDALAEGTRRIGHLRVQAVQADRATLQPVAHDGLPPPPEATLQPGLMLRPVHEPPALGLRVAWRREGCAADCALARAVAQLQREGVPGVALSWVAMGEAPELLLAQQGGRITLRTPGREGELTSLPLQPPGRPAGTGAAADSLAPRLAARLHTVARARNLLRVAAGLAGRGEAGLVSTLQQLPPCGAAPRALEITSVPVLRAGDRLRLEVHNPRDRAIDLTVLYFDAEHGVVALFPGRAGESNRIEPGTRQRIEGIEIHAPPTGTERMLLISAPARRLATARDYAYLAQPPLSRLRAGPGAGPTDPDEGPDLFADAAFAEHTTRGGAAALPAAAPPGVAVQLYTFEVRR